MGAVYIRNTDVVFRKIADEFVLVPIRQRAVDLQSIYTLNDSAAFVWELIDGVRDMDEIREKVIEEFEVDPIAAEADVREIFFKLEALTFIRRA